jgi:hypothetical protein
MFQELSCDEKTPSCGGTCGKVLACGQHQCVERCHAGPCTATCRVVVTKSCRWGLNWAGGLQGPVEEPPLGASDGSYDHSVLQCCVRIYSMHEGPITAGLERALQARDLQHAHCQVSPLFQSQ